MDKEAKTTLEAFFYNIPIKQAVIIIY